MDQSAKCGAADVRARAIHLVINEHLALHGRGGDDLASVHIIFYEWDNTSGLSPDLDDVLRLLHADQALAEYVRSRYLTNVHSVPRVALGIWLLPTVSVIPRLVTAVEAD